MNGKCGGHAVQVKGPTVPRLKAPGFWSLPSTVFVLKQVWWQREETVRAAQERREPARVGLSVCEAMTLLNCSYGELRRRLQAVVPRLKAPGFWSLPSTVFALKQVWWQREETVRAAQERREPARVGLSVCEAMTLLNCSYGELRRRLQAVPRADRRRSKPTLTLRERLRRQEGWEARQQALAATRLRGLTGIGIRVVEGLAKPGPEDSDGPGMLPWEEE